MSKFNGFSTEEINKMTAKQALSKPKPRMMSSNVVKKTLPEKAPKTAVPTHTKLVPEQPAALPIKNDDSETDTSLNMTISSLQEAVHFKPLPSKIYPPPRDDIPMSVAMQQSDTDISTTFQGVSLKDSETHRKVIQEQNRMKKDMLSKAIAQHSEKTAAEVKKLKEIKEELSKLDSQLATDVAYLRKQIEEAAQKFLQKEKYYHQIEGLFLKAKMDLHKAAERKELLAAHLCTIVGHNEDRKAKKLTELMEKVGISPYDGSGMELDNNEKPTNTK